MTTYITQEQATALAKAQGIDAEKDTLCSHQGWVEPIHTLCNAAIQHYRDSLASGVLPPLPVDGLNTINGYDAEDLQDYARQAIADALAKQMPRHTFKRYERDDTEYNGAVYYLASEVDAALAAAPDPKGAV